MRKLFNKLFGVVELSDTFKPKEGRSEKQICRDAYLRLQNEVLASGLLHVESLENGIVKVTLKIKK